MSSLAHIHTCHTITHHTLTLHTHTHTHTHHNPYSAVAARLEAPDTQYELDCIRPDFLLLRVRDGSLRAQVYDQTALAMFLPSLPLSSPPQALSHGLIMWDSIEPTQEWINTHIPHVSTQQRHIYHQQQTLCIVLALCTRSYNQRG